MSQKLIFSFALGLDMALDWSSFFENFVNYFDVGFDHSIVTSHSNILTSNLIVFVPNGVRPIL